MKIKLTLYFKINNQMDILTPEKEKHLLILDIYIIGDEIELQPILSIGWIICDKIEKLKKDSNFEDHIFEKGRVSFLPELFSTNVENQNRYFETLNNENYVPIGIKVSQGIGWFVMSRNWYDRFWSRLPAQFNLFSQESMTPEIAIKKFLSIEDRWEIEEIMCVDPATNLSRIDVAISRYSSRNMGIRHNLYGFEKKVTDIRDFYFQVPKNIRALFKYDKIIRPPDGEAVEIYRFISQVINIESSSTTIY